MGKHDIQKQQADAEQFWSRFSNLPAVKNKRIYVIDPDTVFRLGPRLPQGVQTVARCLHPELFNNPQKSKANDKINVIASEAKQSQPYEVKRLLRRPDKSGLLAMTKYKLFRNSDDFLSEALNRTIKTKDD
jgi:hypothetical protein